MDWFLVLLRLSLTSSGIWDCNRWRRRHWFSLVSAFFFNLFTPEKGSRWEVGVLALLAGGAFVAAGVGILRSFSPDERPGEDSDLPKPGQEADVS